MTSENENVENEQYEPTDEDLDKLRRLLAKEFQDAQKSLAGHRKIVASLKNIQSQAVAFGMEKEFNKQYARLMNRVLPVKKNEASADRLVKLCQTFCIQIQQECKYRKLKHSRQDHR